MEFRKPAELQPETLVYGESSSSLVKFWPKISDDGNLGKSFFIKEIPFGKHFYCF